MASSLGQILQSERGRKDRDCVHGFIKESQSKMDGVAMVDAVMDIVLSYYHFGMDRWDLNAVGKNMRYYKENEEIAMKRSGYNSAFLSEVISNGKFKWTFKITGYNFEDDGYNYLIGIWKTKSGKSTDFLKETYFTKDYTNMYGWLASCKLKSNNYSASCIEKYGVEIKNGDIVEMILDLETTMGLRYTVNGKDFGKAFDVEKTTYRAAVMIAAKNNGIQLLPNKY